MTLTNTHFSFFVFLKRIRILSFSIRNETLMTFVSLKDTVAVLRLAHLQKTS